MNIHIYISRIDFRQTEDTRHDACAELIQECRTRNWLLARIPPILRRWTPWRVATAELARGTVTPAAIAKRPLAACTVTPATGAMEAVNGERPAWTTWPVAAPPTSSSSETTRSLRSGAAVPSNAVFNRRPRRSRFHRQTVAPAPAIPFLRRSMRTTCRCSPIQIRTRALTIRAWTRAWAPARTLT